MQDPSHVEFAGRQVIEVTTMTAAHHETTTATKTRTTIRNIEFAKIVWRNHSSDSFAVAKHVGISKMVAKYTFTNETICFGAMYLV